MSAVPAYETVSTEPPYFCVITQQLQSTPDHDALMMTLERLLATTASLAPFLTPHYAEKDLHAFRRAHDEAQRAQGAARDLLRRHAAMGK